MTGLINNVYASPVNNDLRLSARVRSTDDPDWFYFQLTVKPTKQNREFSGYVIFHLHPTFVNDKIKAKVINGVATYENYAYGAFTVGVEADKGLTKLELDLATLPGAPAAFTQR